MVFTNRYLELGEAFYHKTPPVPVASPSLIIFNQELASSFAGSLSTLDEALLTEIFSGNLVHETSEPLAMAYAGHQFGQFNPQLGDGRAIYLGEVELNSGGTLDIQLKGSGQTRYSRRGDGRSALGPVIREYLVSEAMHALGIPTTRALAAVTSGEQVMRDSMAMIPGGVLTRVATSFIRVGSFQYFAAQGDANAIRKLADYVIERNYPELQLADQPYTGLLEAIVQRQARLIARWMQVGFIHGVMNTDNMSVAGETIDYGPCAFMDDYQHDRVYSYIDQYGRYAYNQQPSIGLWNLTRLAETMLSLFSDDDEIAVNMATDILRRYNQHYAEAWLQGMRAKCGLTAVADDDADRALIQSLFNRMAEGRADFTLTFYYLSQLQSAPDNRDAEFLALFTAPGSDTGSNQDSIQTWLTQWRERLQREPADDATRQLQMATVNPVYIPRNHLIESVIRAAEDRNDFAPFHALHAVLQHPYARQAGKDSYMQPPRPEEEIANTFCGT